MNLFGSSGGDEEPTVEDIQRNEIEQQAFEAAQQKGLREQEVTENANLLRELRRAGIDTDEHPWLEDVLGAETAASHAIGNRGADYEKQVKWGSIGKAMQHNAERSPGRLCTGERLAIAQGAHKKEGRKKREPLSTDEKRALRSAYEAIANFKSLSAAARGLKTVGETTVTAKREVRESEQSLAERAGGLLE